MTPRKQVMAVAAVLVLVGMLDFFQRVHVPRSPSARNPELAATKLPAPPLPLAEARQRMQSWLLAPAPQTDLPEPVEMLGDPGIPAPDRGDLGGWRFVLRGVFDIDAGPPFAVLEVMPKTGGETEWHDLTAGQTIKGVRVQRISGRSVSLSDGENVIDLALFIDPRNNTAPDNEQDE